MKLTEEQEFQLWRQSKTNVEKVALWRKNNPEKRREQARIYRQKLISDPVRHAAQLEKKKKWSKAYRERQKVKGIKQKQRKYSELTDEQKKKRLAKDKRWREAHKEERKAYLKQWYLDNKDKAKEAIAKIHKDNPEYRKNYWKKLRMIQNLMKPRGGRKNLRQLLSILSISVNVILV